MFPSNNPHFDVLKMAYVLIISVAHLATSRGTERDERGVSLSVYPVYFLLLTAIFTKVLMRKVHIYACRH